MRKRIIYVMLLIFVLALTGCGQDKIAGKSYCYEKARSAAISALEAGH